MLLLPRSLSPPVFPGVAFLLSFSSHTCISHSLLIVFFIKVACASKWKLQ